MGQDESQVSTRVDDRQKSPEELRREIEETREDLGDTAAALARKTDVKARAGAAATQAKTKARQNPVMVAAVVALACGLIVRRITSR